MKAAKKEKATKKEVSITSTTHDVVVVLQEDLLGTIPKNKELYERFVESKKPETDGAEEEGDKYVQDLEEAGWTGFLSDETGLFVIDYYIKGFMKNAGNVLKDQFKIRALRSKISDFLFIHPRKIYLGLKEPSGILERSIRVMTLQGPRVALVRSDLISAGTELSFQIELLNHSEVKIQVVRELMNYGRCQGLGQWRNGGYGRFEVVKFTGLK